jgi:hypothetical protein
MSLTTASQQALASQDDATEEGSPAGSADVNQPVAGNVDKIRDILFGRQMRDYDKRFSRLEERLLKESAELRAETKSLFEALETFVKKEVESLSDRLQAEHQDRETSVQSVTGELRETGKSLETKLQLSVERANRTHGDLRQQILDQSKYLVDEMRQRHEELSSTIGRELAEMNHEKTDRASLSALFTEVAMRLNNEFKMPGDS